MILRNLAFNRRILREVGCVGSRPTLRSMSAGCWKCGTATRPLELFCPADSCGAVQSLELHQINAFDLFRVDHYYDLDQKALETNFKEIQKQLHPDKFTTKSTPEREASNTTSSTANQAYQILRSPISRAEYMVRTIHKPLYTAVHCRSPPPPAPHTPKPATCTSHTSHPTRHTVQIHPTLDTPPLTGL